MTTPARRTPPNKRVEVFPRRPFLLGVAALLIAIGLSPTPSSAATSPITTSGTRVTLNGHAATAVTTLKASTTVSASRYGVCARNRVTGVEVDFPFVRDSPIRTSGTPYSGTRAFAAGTYSVFACVQIGRQWSAVGGSQSFTVPAAPPLGTAPRGDLPGWKQVFVDDFNASVVRGRLLADPRYGSRWFAYSGYADTSGRGNYEPAAVLSTSGGALDWYVHTAGGRHKVAAMVPIVPATGWGQKYGRYSVRFRSDELPGYKLAFMLWPDTDNWGEGEVDFPEVGSLERGNHLYANLYQRGNTATRAPGPTTGFTTTTDAAGSGWHVATTEWSPGKLSYLLDGKTLGTLTAGVPDTSFHMVLQVETMAGGPAPSAAVAGHVQVDWVTMYGYAP